MFSRSARFIASAAVLTATCLTLACTPPPPAPPKAPPAPNCLSKLAKVPTSPTSVMGKATVSVDGMVAWYGSKTKGRSGLGATVSVRDLATMFIQEGCDESVRGDIAFVQAMLETGWLSFSTRMPKENNNFSGIGAVDGGSSSAKFPSARAGVRAQIQHLRAYADSTVTEAKLSHPLVDPRFNLVTPKGRADDWSKFGNGIWATDPDYATKIQTLYNDLQSFVG